MALPVSSTSQTTTAAISIGLPSASFTLTIEVSRFRIRVDTRRRRVNGFTHCSPGVRMVPRYRPNSWITRASPVWTGVRPWKQSSDAMKIRMATTLSTTARVPWPCSMISTTPTITPTIPSPRIGKPGTDLAWYSLTGWAGNFGTATADTCVFINPPALADLIFSFPPEEAPGNQGDDQRVAGQHQQWLLARELALPRVLDRFHRRPERGEVADVLERARHELP